MNTWVLIPCHRLRLDDLRASLSHLNHPAEKTVIVTTQPEPIKPTDTAATVLRYEGTDINISRWWNIGLDWIEEHHEVGPYEVLCMESDVRIDW
jgi:hypothetical protein